MKSFRNIRDNGIQKVANSAERLSLNPTDGDIVEQLVDHSIYVYDGTTNSWLLISQPIPSTDDKFVDMKEPNGFVNRTDSAISFNASNRTLTVSCVSSNYDIYVASNKITISTTKTKQIPDLTGTYYFYFDADGELQYITTFNIALISSYAYVAYLYWDTSATDVDEKIVTFGEERHGITMDGTTHAYLHTTHGAAFGNGCGLNNFSISQNVAADAQFNSLSGLIWDEDINLQINSQTQFPVLYKSGSTWKKKKADAFPIIYSGSAGFVGPQGLIAYNNFNGTSWSLQEVDNNKFVLIHVFATNDKNYPVICILGQEQYIDKTAAKNGAEVEISKISGLPTSEFCPIGSVIFQTRSSFSTNSKKAQVVLVETGVYYVDHRLENIRPGVLN